MSKLILQETTEKIIKSYYNVYNHFGYGFNENLYKNALFIELNSIGLKVELEKRITVFYKDVLVGEFYADLLVEDSVILEIKAVEKLLNIHEMQILNYLKSTKFEVGLLMNFGKPEFKRSIFTNDKKVQSNK
jgi:GxxExxY protein